MKDTYAGSLRRLWGFVSDYQAQHGYSPSLREVAAGCGWASGNAAWRWMKRLEATGYVTRDRSGPQNGRTVRVNVPLLTQVGAAQRNGQKKEGQSDNPSA